MANTTEDKLTRLDETKSMLTEKLIEQGLDVPDNATFLDRAALVGEIKSKSGELYEFYISNGLGARDYKLIYKNESGEITEKTAPYFTELELPIKAMNDYPILFSWEDNGGEFNTIDFVSGQGVVSNIFMNQTYRYPAVMIQFNSDIEAKFVST